MPSTTTYNFGDVVLVPFPFTNQQNGKQRPAVIISSAAYQRSKPDVIVMAITSQLRPSQSLGEHALRDWQQAGLLKPSLLKPVITSLEQGLIIKTMGQLGAHDLTALRLNLKAIIG